MTMRIVSLACSNTEIVHALGCSDRLVGVDDHSDWPTEVVGPLPKVGPDLDIDVERVAALEPDLVLATLTVPGHEKVVERLEAAGLPWIAPEPVSLDDVYRDILDIGARLEVAARATEVVAGMRTEIRPVEVEDADRPSVLVQWWPKPVISPGRRSWVTDLIHLAGGRSPLDEEVKSRPIEDDEVARMAPDVVSVSWCGVDPVKYRPEVVRDNPAFAAIPAVLHDRVVSIPEAFLGRPGPRLIDGYRALRAIIDRVRTDRDSGANPGAGTYR